MPYNPSVPYRGDINIRGMHEAGTSVMQAIMARQEREEGLRDLAKGADNIRKGSKKAGLNLPGLDVDDAEWNNLSAKDRVSRVNSSLQLYQMQQQQAQASSQERYRQGQIQNDRDQITLEAVRRYQAAGKGPNEPRDFRSVSGKLFVVLGNQILPADVPPTPGAAMTTEKPADIPGYQWGPNGKGGWKAYQIPAATVKEQATEKARDAKNDPLAGVRKQYSTLAQTVADDQVRVANGNLTRPGGPFGVGGVNYFARLQGNIRAMRELERLYPELRGGAAPAVKAAPAAAAAARPAPVQQPAADPIAEAFQAWRSKRKP